MCPLYVHDQLALHLNRLMKEASETKEHEITYLVDQKHKHVADSSSNSRSGKAPGKKDRERDGLISKHNPQEVEVVL